MADLTVTRSHFQRAIEAGIEHAGLTGGVDSDLRRLGREATRVGSTFLATSPNGPVCPAATVGLCDDWKGALAFTTAYDAFLGSVLGENPASAARTLVIEDA